MADIKSEPRSLVGSVGDREALPAYELTDPGPSAHTEQEQAPEGSVTERSANVPTVDSPFNFPPPDGPAPDYQKSADPMQRPIAIPQMSPEPISPFLSAFVPSLLAYGITNATWASFLGTISAFLEAKVSDRAIFHAGDMAKKVGNGPKSFGKNLAAHAKEIGHDIGGSAKRGNILGAAMGVVRGVIGLPLHAAVGLVTTTVRVPGSTVIAAATQKSQMPRDRAASYAAVSNEKWFYERGLQAQLLNTRELGRLVGVPPVQFLEIANSSEDKSAAAQLGALSAHISELDVATQDPLKLGEETLWLVITKL
jgi:hypothetical protein